MVATASAVARGARSGARSGGAFGQLTELKQRLLFLLLALFVYRVFTHVPVPGINPLALGDFLQQNQGTILDVFNLFSGGALERFSVCTLSVVPYITASIVVQMFSAIEPRLKQLRKEGESGRRKLTSYTRYLTVLLAVMQSIAVAYGFESIQATASGPVVLEPGLGFRVTASISLVTGTMFLVWLGEQITERGVGNGISMIIFASIVAGLPAAIGGTAELARTGELGIPLLFGLGLLAIAVTALVAFIEMGQRRIPVNYAKRQMPGGAYSGRANHMPLKLNMAGVIPPIFASSLILFPSTVARWFGEGSGPGFLQDVATMLQPGNPLYMGLFALGISFFCFFYTALVFDSNEIADNLKRSGAFVAGLRPGNQTAQYLDKVLLRLTTAGAIYITTICLMPELLLYKLSVPFYFGGTSLLIIVVVVMDFMAQVQAHLMSHQYDSLLKKANLKGGRRR